MIVDIDIKTYPRRMVALAVGLVLLAIVVALRIYSLQVSDQNFLRAQGDARTVRMIKMPAYRGIISDRNGEPLAVSTPVESVWMNPKLVNPNHPQLKTLAKILQQEPKSIVEKIAQYKNREFAYLKRHVSPQVAQQIRRLGIMGIKLDSEYRRYYPQGEVTAHVLGFTNIDDAGQEGLEHAYNDWLSGQAGVKRIVRDRVGREVEYIESVNTTTSGQALQLSLDQRVQYLAYRELKQAVEKHKAVAGTVVVLDVHSGEVLAMVNQPSFNPNLRHRRIKDESYRNRAVTDVFEPASAAKAFSMASVLEYGDVTPNTVVDTSPGVMKLAGGVVRDLRNHGRIDVSTIMKRSSNIGISKLVLALPEGRMVDMYQRLGFGNSTASGFPGESSGIVTSQNRENPFVRATLSFGYGLAVTPLQLARAYAVFGNEGVLLPVSFTKVDGAIKGQRVMRPSVAREVLAMLAGVVEDGGSGKRARVAGYHMAGKTGTARKIGSNGYADNSHVALFAGLAPAINPRFAIVVVVDEPRQGTYYSSLVAAPVFSKIASGALRLYNIPPALLDTQGVHVAQIGSSHS